MYNVILFWLIVFYIIYIFTRKERDEEREDEKGGELMSLPCRREEIRRILKDDLTREERETEMKRFGHRCFNCGSTENLEIDHHLPLTRGYPLRSQETGSNAVVLCRRCNSRKGAALPGEFYSEEKLKKLEEMGIRSHLYYTPLKIAEIEEVMTGDKVQRLRGFADEGAAVSFSYYDMSRIMFVREDVEEVPVKVYSRRRIEKYTSGWDWFLEGSSGRMYNISWLYRLRRRAGDGDLYRESGSLRIYSK